MALFTSICAATESNSIYIQLNFICVIYIMELFDPLCKFDLLE